MAMPWHALAGDVAIRVSVILGADNEVEKVEDEEESGKEEEGDSAAEEEAQSRDVHTWGFW